MEQDVGLQRAIWASMKSTTRPAAVSRPVPVTRASSDLWPTDPRPRPVAAPSRNTAYRASSDQRLNATRGGGVGRKDTLAREGLAPGGGGSDRLRSPIKRTPVGGRPSTSSLDLSRDKGESVSGWSPLCRGGTLQRQNPSGSHLQVVCHDGWDDIDFDEVPASMCLVSTTALPAGLAEGGHAYSIGLSLKMHFSNSAAMLFGVVIGFSPDAHGARWVLCAVHRQATSKDAYAQVFSCQLRNGAVTNEPLTTAVAVQAAQPVPGQYALVASPCGATVDFTVNRSPVFSAVSIPFYESVPASPRFGFCAVGAKCQVRDVQCCEGPAANMSFTQHLPRDYGRGPDPGSYAAAPNSHSSAAAASPPQGHSPGSIRPTDRREPPTAGVGRTSLPQHPKEDRERRGLYHNGARHGEAPQAASGQRGSRAAGGVQGSRSARYGGDARGGGDGGKGSGKKSSAVEKETDRFVEMIERDILDANPNVQWEDIAALTEAKRLLNEAVVLPMIAPELFTGIRAPWRGVLLFGPPGTGKTLLAKAVATCANTTFFNMTASSVVSKWHGESEKMIKTLFSLARKHAPSTIFFDEIDSLMMKRGDSSEHEASRRMKSELLTEMNGMNSSTSDARIMILATSNKPWDLDEGFRRRFEKRIYIPLPEEEARQSLFEINIKGVAVDANVSFAELARATAGYSGADIHQVCRDAAMGPIRRLIAHKSPADIAQMKQEGRLTTDNPLTMLDFEESISKIQPSVAAAEVTRYKKWESEFASG
ncbi:Katanin p60 ATPase-containing subunit A1 [Diplonema papillatum]|nr:Katanin p60 ATPase-containing subunit A1 [Diplonema papillatum]